MIGSVTEASRPQETAALSGLDKDAFLKLLVAQLRYQNPMSPLDGQEYLAQAAQFAQVERLETVAQAQNEVIAYQRVLLSSSLVGRHVKGNDELQQPVEGVVDGVHFEGAMPVLDIGGRRVALDAVEEISKVDQAGGTSTP